MAQTTTNTWDALGDELSTADANGTTSMAYNLAGQMTSLTDPDNNETIFNRDNLGRVTSEQNPSGTETMAYDANSNLGAENGSELLCRKPYPEDHYVVGQDS